ncbi:MAG: HAMP domain-containing histidine kinase [Muribaculaceae bacterium]|nr:HAMP domain-containing histidine kinase [Muribaculaceae bacterium]
MTALADTDIDDMWERSERARQIARAKGQEPIELEETPPNNDSQHGRVSGSIDENGDLVTTRMTDDGNVYQQKSMLVRDNSYTNQMMKAMSQQMHEAMDQYYGYDLNITDSIFRSRLADRGIYPEFAAIEIVDEKDSVLLASSIVVDNNSDYDVFHLCFNPENRWIYRASVTPLTRHILSQMLGVIVTVFLLMGVFALAFWYLFHTVSKLRTIEEMKDDFVSNMTHELKTPIAIAYSANDALLNFDSDNDPSKKETYLKIANRQLIRLRELVENILALSMERRKTLKLKKENILLAPLLEDIVEAQRMRKEKEIIICIDVNEEISVVSDKEHLSNVFNNLIDNSIKYSGDSVKIDIKCRNNVISVSDNGIGIPDKSIPYVFNKFYRVPHGNRQDVRGYGIGLYYVKSILDRMGWSISVKSKDGKGTVFTIKFNDNERENSFCRG